jgi:hypothetical protein
MRTLLLLVAVLFAVPSTSRAEASVSIHFDLPVVLPQLVVVSPGVQVVPEVEEEVFFVDGFYWVRRDHTWYRSRSHRSGWVLVPARVVPQRIGGLPPGKYKRWKPEHGGRGRGRGHDDDHGHDHHDGHGHGHKGKGGKHGKH